MTMATRLIDECVSAAAQRERDVSRVLEEMIANGEYITVGSVARRAGVSRSFVYRHTAIAQRIKEVRVPNMTKDELRAELVRERAKNNN